MEDLNCLRAVYGGIETSQTMAFRSLQLQGDFRSAIRDEIEFYFLEARKKGTANSNGRLEKTSLPLPLI
jgi:hypothetical protein